MEHERQYEHLSTHVQLRCLSQTTPLIGRAHTRGRAAVVSAKRQRPNTEDEWSANDKLGKG